MKNKALLILFIPVSLAARCRCFEPAEQPKKKDKIPVIVVPPVAKPEHVVEQKPQQKPEQALQEPVMPDVDEPANLKAQATRVGIMAVAAVTGLYLLSNILSLSPIEQAILNNR